MCLPVCPGRCLLDLTHLCKIYGVDIYASVKLHGIQFSEQSNKFLIKNGCLNFSVPTYMYYGNLFYHGLFLNENF